ADKIDSIAGCFSIGLMPSGSEDPYALRRQGTGLVLNTLEAGLRLSLSSLLEEALAALSERLDLDSPAAQEVKEKVLSFLGQRLQGVLSDQGFAPDLIEAVLAAGFDDLVAARKRAQALSSLRQRPDFENLAVAFKRVMNILPPGFSAVPHPQLFQQEAEKQLWKETQIIREKLTPLLAQEDFLAALEEISTLRPAVDRFFNEVMVMAKEEELRQNRLALLYAVSQLLAGLADLSQLVVA
ncbi:MAG: glycine--tRNA ligase subunit beta, partial [candidate division NC10 bacterium]|nr:glycine--tRNA ligase subunit beta [candidate division NC10 bacterium]